MNTTVIAETVRRHYTSAVTVGYLAFMMLMTALTPNAGAPGSVWHPMFALLVIVSGAQLIGPEFDSGTLQLVLMKPVRRSVYLVSRVAGVIVIIWISAWILVAVEGASVMRVGHTPAWRDLSALGVNVSAKAFLSCSLLVLFGSMSRAYFNVAYYFFLQMFLSAGPSVLRMFRDKPFIQAHPEIQKALLWAGANLYPPEPANIDRDWLLLVFSNAAILLVLACFIFRRREVPYGAD